MGDLEGGAPSSKQIRELFHSTLDLVERVARRVWHRIGRAAELEDLVGWGREGLLDAACRYDRSRGVPFEGYAYYRVLGAVYDGVRRSGDLPPALLAEMARASNAAALGEGAAEVCFAREADASPASERLFDEHLTAVALAASIDRVAGSARGPSSPVAAEGPASPEMAVANAELLHLLEQGLTLLTQEEAEVVRRHYFADEPLSHIAESLGMSRSWASRLHARAIERLSRWLRSRD
ncbi:MAG TPA: sigma-70 family RNA polymerase sigma factor [Polyangiaceae bacterium]